MSEDRIDMYYETCLSTCTGTGTQTLAKAKKEIVGLTKFVHKHQNETVTDKAKVKIFTCAEKYKKYITSREGDAREEEEGMNGEDEIMQLFDKLLKIPEKLITSKSKSKVLQWQEAVLSKESGGGTGSKGTGKCKNESSNATAEQVWELCDVSGTEVFVSEVGNMDNSAQLDLQEEGEEGALLAVLKKQTLEAADGGLDGEEGMYVRVQLDERGEVVRILGLATEEREAEAQLNEVNTSKQGIM